MNSPRSATRRVLTTASSMLVLTTGAVGCGDAPTAELGSQLAEVTANNFADLAAASAEAARAAYMTEQFSMGIGRTVYLQYIETPPMGANPAGPLAGLVDPICNFGGTSTVTPDPAVLGRYQAVFTACQISEPGQVCTLDGMLVVDEGAFGGEPFASEGIDLTLDCSVLGAFDLDGSRIECPYQVEGGGPYWNIDFCDFDIASLRGDVTGLDFEVVDVETAGYPFDFDVLATIVDPDYGQLTFEALNLDIDSCSWATPYSGLIGGGREENVAPAFWVIFDGDCDQFTACYFETQAYLDMLQCTLTSVVLWDDIAAP